MGRPLLPARIARLNRLVRSPGSSSLTDGELYRIPRKIHHIWLGSSPLPQPFARLRESWGSWHPGWELRLWTDADIDGFGLENRLAFDSATNFGAKSDIFRYEVRGVHAHRDSVRVEGIPAAVAPVMMRHPSLASIGCMRYPAGSSWLRR